MKLTSGYEKTWNGPFWNLQKRRNNAYSFLYTSSDIRSTHPAQLRVRTGNCTWRFVASIVFKVHFPASKLLAALMSQAISKCVQVLADKRSALYLEVGKGGIARGAMPRV
jgi:hypothetical protein